ncbi:MAG: TIGR03756 family integrating conjugative element protein [Gammaproteobacteria bacterium]|nr:TIGR03756 family integrating conjugative element protein [Gammaproteobacteria bacterium]
MSRPVRKSVCSQPAGERAFLPSPLRGNAPGPLLSAATATRRALAAAWLALGALGHAAETISSADILAASADFGCLDYRAVGACLWLRCSGVPPSCTTATSVKYRHFVPDAVVTAYPARGLSPWTEMRALDGAAEGGTYAKGAGSRAATGLRFKLTQAVGSPGIAWIEGLNLGRTVCDPVATQLAPYYVSGADPMWRAPEAQAASTLRHALRAVREPGALGSLWGALYPRTGFVQQGHDYKAGAVAAQRVADIVTRRNQPHVYRPLLGGSGGGQWPPGAVVEGDADTHRWQMLAPRTGSCAVFAASASPPVGTVDPLGANVSSSGAYAWNLWRPYRCCRRRGQWLVSHWGN